MNILKCILAVVFFMLCLYAIQMVKRDLRAARETSRIIKGAHTYFGYPVYFKGNDGKLYRAIGEEVK